MIEAVAEDRHLRSGSTCSEVHSVHFKWGSFIIVLVSNRAQF